MKLNRTIVLFVAAMALLSVAGGIFDSTSNNYYAQTFHMTAEQRGQLELPREFPGFMVAVMSGALFFVAEAYVGAIAATLVAFGMIGLALFARSADQYGQMLVLLIVWSAGTHLLMPVSQSLSLDLAEQESEGEKLGKLGSLRSGAAIVGCVVVWVCFGLLGNVFHITFIVGAVIAALSALVMIVLGAVMPPVHRHARPKLVLRRRYTLFYVLSAIFGARKQVFITFGPWVLIILYNQGAQTIAKLQIVATLLGVILLPRVGRLIDTWGERAILMADGAVMTLVCLSYGFAQDVFSPGFALSAVCAAYVADQFLFGVQMARATYLSKIAESRADIGGALSLSTSLDHAVSIPIAMLGGWLWQATGSHRLVFLIAAGIAVLTFLASSFIRIERVVRPELVEPPEQAREDMRGEAL
jgi:MFS family permease